MALERKRAAKVHSPLQFPGAGVLRGRNGALLRFLVLPLLIAAPPSLSLAGSSFSVEVLSRGGGVPAAALEALRQVREALEAYAAEGVAIEVSETRIGLEGERRLCAEFEEAQAADAALRRVESIVAGVDLVNLKAEACSG